MTVTVTIQQPDGSIIGSFPGEDNISLAQIAKNHGIAFPTSCGIGSCGVCKCSIIHGKEHIQIDKISPPNRPLARDADGNFVEVLACIGGIKKDSLQDPLPYTIVLEKHI